MRITLDKVLQDPKPKPLSYFERRMPQNKQKHRNHYKFVGILPDFHGFERTRNHKVLKLYHFKEKRTFINIFEFLAPDELLLTVKLVCKKFYMLSWNEELLKKVCFHAFGFQMYEEIKYRVAKHLHRVKNGQDDKQRYFVETTTEEENSASFSSDNENKAHLREDDCSSAEEENALKEMFRRNAKEDYYFRRDLQKQEEERKRDLQVIEKCRFNKEPVPQELRDRYRDELEEYGREREAKDREYQNLTLMKRKERLEY